MNGNYKELLPEIAELLNTSVSELETRPEDVKSILGQIYVNNYFSDVFEIKKELGKVIDLNAATRAEIKAYEQQKILQKNSPESSNEVQEREEKQRNIYFSREQRRKMAEKLQPNEKSEQHEQNNDIELKNGG